jgi:hypothetical protein
MSRTAAGDERVEPEQAGVLPDQAGPRKTFRMFVGKLLGGGVACRLKLEGQV